MAKSHVAEGRSDQHLLYLRSVVERPALMELLGGVARGERLNLAVVIGPKRHDDRT